MNDTTDTALEAAAEGRDVGPGHNQPPLDMLLRADDLLATYGSLEEAGKFQTMAADVATLLARIGGRVDGEPGVPEKIETDTENGVVAAYMADLRTTIKTVDSHREAEKAPYLTTERAIQNYFGSYLARLEKTRDILQARGNDYTRRKAAQARAAAEAIAAAERKKAAEIAAAAQAERQKALDAAAAAARARKPENIDKLETAAVEATQNAQILAIDEMVQGQKADEAEAQTLASTAALTRTKFETGHMATGKEVGHVEITDIEKIDLNLLRPYLKSDVILAALKKLGAHLDYKKPATGMDGVVMEYRDKADYR